MRLILSNIIWLFFDRVIENFVKFVVGIWLARYLGPEGLGVIHYALAIILIATPFGELGQANIVIRNIVEKKCSPEVLLGTSFTLTFFACLLVFCIINGYSVFFASDEQDEAYIISVLSGMIMFRMFFVITWWYQAQVLSKYTVIATRIAMVVSAIVKVGLILSQAPIWVFAWTWLLQGTVTSILLIRGYSQRHMSLLEWRFDFLTAKRLLSSSWPLILTSVASIIYLHIDKIMIGVLSGNREVGLYTAASRLTEVFYVLPLILTATLFPALIRSKELSTSEYTTRIQSLIDVMVVYSYIVVLIVFFYASAIVDVLYGKQYHQSAEILIVHAFGLIFMATGVVRNRWLISENKTRFLMIATSLGALVNVTLNLALIPSYHSVGAAWATVISYGVSTYISCLLAKEYRLVFKVLSKGYAVPIRLGDLVTFAKKLIFEKIMPMSR